jgi:hypothetical protein
MYPFVPLKTGFQFNFKGTQICSFAIKGKVKREARLGKGEKKRYEETGKKKCKRVQRRGRH